MEPKRSLIKRILARAEDKDCHPRPDVNLCERTGESVSKEVLVVLVVCAVVFISAFLMFLWYLHTRRQRMEDREDHKTFKDLDDYGLSDYKPPKVNKKNLPKEPPPVYNETRAENVKRSSVDSLTPSLKEVMGMKSQQLAAR